MFTMSGLEDDVIFLIKWVSGVAAAELKLRRISAA